MIPFFVLMAVFAVCRALGWIGATYFSEWQHCLRFALAAMFLLTSSAHWGAKRADLIRMVPSAFPRPDIWVTLTGIAEIAGAIGLPSVDALPEIGPILLVQSAYRLIATVSVRRGFDPDRPAHLRKVTETV